MKTAQAFASHKPCVQCLALLPQDLSDTLSTWEPPTPPPQLIFTKLFNSLDLDFRYTSQCQKIWNPRCFFGLSGAAYTPFTEAICWCSVHSPAWQWTLYHSGAQLSDINYNWYTAMYHSGVEHFVLRTAAAEEQCLQYVQCTMYTVWSL